MITTETYQRKLKRARKILSKRIAKFVENQDPDNVHDLRTASRRLLAYIQLLPGSLRKKRRVRRLSALLEEVIRRNATVRDVDIILSKVSSYPDGSTHQELLGRLADQRLKNLKPGLRLAPSFRKAIGRPIKLDRMLDEELQVRFEKVNRKLESKIRERLPIVLGDPAKKRELHRLREDSRRLRYVLDIAGTPDTPGPMNLLRSWQDILGLIHDSDITIDFLQGENPSPEIQDLLRKEVMERNANYEKFASMATTKLALRISEQR